MIAALEAAIVNRLAASTDLKPLKVEAWPDDVGEFSKAMRRGGVLVGYKGSKFAPPGELDFVVQDAQGEFQVLLAVKGLRSHEGAYPYLATIKRLLTGWKPADGGTAEAPAPGLTVPFYPVDEQFEDLAEGLWLFNVTFACGYVHVETRDEGADAEGTIQRITQESEYGNVEVPGEDE